MKAAPRTILGLSYGHGDSSAALVVGGRLVAAAEEERFNRVKHFGAFPSESIAYCLRHAGIEAAAVDCVAVGRKPGNALARKVALTLTHPGLWRRPPPADGPTFAASLAAAGLGRARLARIEHHAAHLWSARFLAGDGAVALLSFDGLGDFVSAALGRAGAAGGPVEIVHRVHYPHSVGFFYTAMTQYLGFPHFGDEFKVMGLSSYGTPRFLPQLRQVLRDDGEFGFALDLETLPLLTRPLRLYLENAQPKIDPFFDTGRLEALLGFPPRAKGATLDKHHEDLAASIQARFEEVATRLVLDLHRRVGGEVLGLAGGCAHNSVWVGKIPRLTPYKRILVAPASHDAGIAVGAAIGAAAAPVTAEADNWMLLGPSGAESAPAVLPPSLTATTYDDEDALVARLADALASGQIVGLFHGRMEFGPRALGSRSILADPRGPGMKDKLNARVKHREAFRPFAASVLEEEAGAWFEDVFHAPTMEAVFPVRSTVRAQIPAVVHADGSCRIQTVSRRLQPFYWRLIQAFHDRTGVPMLLNTSFNDSEPIVCTESDAVNCFLNCDMDLLALGARVCERRRR